MIAPEIVMVICAVVGVVIITKMQQIVGDLKSIIEVLHHITVHDARLYQKGIWHDINKSFHGEQNPD